MANKKRNLLEVLELELEFLKSGGYRKMSSWRPQFMFEDSPTCLNCGNPEHRPPCSECVLMQMVPPEFRDGKVPCRYIPLNDQSENIQSLYQWGTPEELEAAVREWLMSTIQKLELERTPGQPDPDSLAKRSVGNAEKKLRSEETMFSRCSNPDCENAFDYRRGRLFRFHNQQSDGQPAVEPCRCVRHFWLCDGCSRTYALEYHLGMGVAIRSRLVTEPVRPVCCCPMSRASPCLAE